MYKSETTLVVKNDASGYSRKALVKFPVKDIPEYSEKVSFLFELSGMPSETFTNLDLYETEGESRIEKEEGKTPVTDDSSSALPAAPGSWRARRQFVFQTSVFRIGKKLHAVPPIYFE